MNCPNCKSPIKTNDSTCDWCYTPLEIKFDIDEDILELISENHILAAVKFYSERYNKTLYESKMYIDEIRELLKKRTSDLNNLIPDTCPHCKSPNNKRIRLCEWCGNQII